MSVFSSDISKSSEARKQLLYIGALVATAAIGTALAWPSFLPRLLAHDYLPHLYCYLGKPGLVWTHVVADSAIGVSYLAISGTLGYLVWRNRREIPFHWMILAFGVFIVACGGTHIVEVVTIWVPIYVFSAVVKVLTAVASIATAIALFFQLPRITTLIRKTQEANLTTLLLERSESRLRAIRASAPDAIISSDPTGAIVAFNGAAETLFAKSADEVIGKRITDLMPSWPTTLTENIPIGEGQHAILCRALDMNAPQKDGSEVPLSLSLSAWKAGSEIGFTSIVRDMTERNRWEQRLLNLLDAAPDATIVADQRGVIVQVNRQTTHLFGYEREDLAGRSIEDLVPRRLRDRNLVHRVRFGEDPHIRPMGGSLELYGLHKDGHEFPVEISLSPLQTDDGLLILSAIRDITERKKGQDRVKALNVELKRSNAELKAVNKELESFSYSVSHDLRAPLRAIDGFSLALIEDCGPRLSEEEESHLNRIRAAAKKMGKLIDDLLVLARTARKELVRERVDLSALAIEICAQLRTGNPGRSVTASIEAGMCAEGDRTLLRLVLENLLSNAWKFTSQQENAQVEFGTENKKVGTVFFIRDNGAGFDMRYADKLFGAFQRLHDEQDFPGTGVGLATVQRIIHRHGGHIWANAEPMKGSTFHFILNSEERMLQEETTKAGGVA